MDRVKNYTVAIKEWNDQNHFLRRVSKASGQVLRHSGGALRTSEAVIRRAVKCFANLEKAEFNDQANRWQPQNSDQEKGRTGDAGRKTQKPGKGHMGNHSSVCSQAGGLIFQEIADLKP